MYFAVHSKQHASVFKEGVELDIKQIDRLYWTANGDFQKRGKKDGRVRNEVEGSNGGNIKERMEETPWVSE